MLNNQGKTPHEIQSSTLELINGLVTLVQQPNMPDVGVEAMEALLVLHQPDKIEMWNPEHVIHTFWDVNSQVRKQGFFYLPKEWSCAGHSDFVS